MIEKPKRPKQLNNQDRKIPASIQELITRYDLDNTDIYNFLDYLVNSINNGPKVIDNLTSQSSTDSLSAKQGKVLNEKVEGTVLYSNSTGTSGNVILSDSVANYDYIEIQATRTLHTYSSGKLYNVNGKTITLTSTYTTDEHFYVYSKTMNVSGNTLTAVSSKMIYMNDSMTRYQVDNDNRIIRVVGYKS